MDFAVPVDNRVTMKESKKIDKYLDLARELKNWNMRLTVIPVVVGALRTVDRGLGNYWRNWKSEEESEASRLQHGSDQLEYSEKYRRPEDTYCYSYFGEIPPTNAGVKHS